MKLSSFDLEIAKQLPEHQCPVCLSENVATVSTQSMCANCGKFGKMHEFRSNWKNHRPLGITCAALMAEPDNIDNNPLAFWYYPNKLNQQQSKKIVTDLITMTDTFDYKIVTWNGLNFDFDVLAEESGMYEECAELALNHIDLMLITVTLRGHFLGLDKAAKGANIQGKLKQVKLKDGTPLENMSGGKAPGLWKAGEYQAVLDYLAEDVRVTLELAQWIEQNKMIRWTSYRGYEQFFHVPKLYTVRECLELSRNTIPEWVTNPIELKSMMEWIK